MIKEMIRKFKNWLSGKNTCPKCGAIHYFYSVGIFNRLCVDCYGDKKK